MGRGCLTCWSVLGALFRFRLSLWVVEFHHRGSFSLWSDVVSWGSFWFSCWVVIFRRLGISLFCQAFAWLLGTFVWQSFLVCNNGVVVGRAGWDMVVLSHVVCVFVLKW